jgi:DNA-binding transcriptional ArsR family regulator
MTTGPNEDVTLTPGRLRGLVHPLRVRLLGLLQREGPATATQLAQRIGQNSGTTSYHLRVLAENGFIREDAEKGNARDRWWAAAHRTTSLTFRAPDDPGDPETIELASHFIRMLVDVYHERMVRYVDGLAADLPDLPSRPWQFSDTPVRLSVEQARELTEQVNALVRQYFREPGDPDPTPDTVRGVFQFQLLPDEVAADGTERPDAG